VKDSSTLQDSSFTHSHFDSYLWKTDRMFVEILVGSPHYIVEVVQTHSPGLDPDFRSGDPDRNCLGSSLQSSSAVFMITLQYGGM